MIIVLSNHNSSTPSPTTELWFTGYFLGANVAEQHVLSFSRTLEPRGKVVEQIPCLLGDDIIVDLGTSLGDNWISCHYFGGFILNY